MKLFPKITKKVPEGLESEINIKLNWKFPININKVEIRQAFLNFWNN